MSLGTYRTFILLLGDVILLWVALFVTLIVRYGPADASPALNAHLYPFSFLIPIWIVIFYIARLYEVRLTNAIPGILQSLLYALLASGIVSMALFYSVPSFQITPKLTLVIDIVISAVLVGAWRMLFSYSIKTSSKVRVLLLGSSPDIKELASTIESYPEAGYKIVARIATPDQHVMELLKTHAFDIAVAPKDIQADNRFVQEIYEALHQGIRFIDASIFYERLLGKIPVSLISKVWFLENIAETEKRFFESLKRLVDVLIALILGIIAVFLIPFAAFFIAWESAGPIFIRQKRVGRMGKIFTLVKLRTMYALSPEGHAELQGAEWSGVDDKRITRVGRILRSTRVDELPQLWNVFRGELSFVGPRPERPEFVEQLKKSIPFYDMRHLVRPGLSGWAQINPPFYYASTEETILKLQYDLFYIKNRDLGLDLAIALKTLMVLLTRQGR
jgi:exopolysaccharide biosynthesis polyprenyl glycosylphosphotransferase